MDTPLSAAISGHPLPDPPKRGAMRGLYWERRVAPGPTPVLCAHIFVLHPPSPLPWDTHPALAPTCDVNIVVQSHQGKAPFVVIGEVGQNHPSP